MTLINLLGIFHSLSHCLVLEHKDLELFPWISKQLETSALDIVSRIFRITSIHFYKAAQLLTCNDKSQYTIR